VLSWSEHQSKRERAADEAEATTLVEAGGGDVAQLCSDLDGAGVLAGEPHAGCSHERRTDPLPSTLIGGRDQRDCTCSPVEMDSRIVLHAARDETCQSITGLG
jgi:hypothetical protein